MLGHFKTQLKTKTKLLVILSLIPSFAFHRLQEFCIYLTLESSAIVGAEVSKVLLRYCPKIKSPGTLDESYCNKFSEGPKYLVGLSEEKCSRKKPYCLQEELLLRNVSMSVENLENRERTCISKHQKRP